MKRLLDRALSSHWFVFFATVILHGAATRGRPRANPDTGLYITLADGLLYGDQSGIFNLDAVRWTKLIYLSLLAAARAISPEHFMMIMMLLNIFLSGIAAVLLVDLVRRTTPSVAAPAAALVFYLAAFDIFHWMSFVMTDVLFILAAFIPFALVARGIFGDFRGRRIWLGVALCAAVFTRPPGVVIVVLTIVAELLFVGDRTRAQKRAVAIVLLTGMLGALLIRTYVVHDPACWPFRFIRPKIVEFANREKTGEVIYDRLEVARRPPRTYNDHLAMQGVRFVRFFQFTSSTFSRFHNLLNLIYFIPLYLLAVMGTVWTLRAADHRRRRLVLFAVMWIVTFAFFQAITVLDFDWRFRTPMLLEFIVLAAFGVDQIARGVAARAPKSVLHDPDRSGGR
ncbi:MAG: hypothetical protein JJE51_04930 [Thermoanaerobaculia bacterium]|nr:hypothetical protein [Thermoanaerobaculia bacterium]